MSPLFFIFFALYRLILRDKSAKTRVVSGGNPLDSVTTVNPWGPWERALRALRTLEVNDRKGSWYFYRKYQERKYQFDGVFGAEKISQSNIFGRDSCLWHSKFLIIQHLSQSRLSFKKNKFAVNSLKTVFYSRVDNHGQTWQSYYFMAWTLCSTLCMTWSWLFHDMFVTFVMKYDMIVARSS